MYRILIADDEARDRNIIKILLERRYSGQFELLEAENGVQALEMLEGQPVQLLLLDINMPVLSGIELLHHLTYMPYVIVLTAHSCFEYTRDALRCGVRDYLIKPPLREEFYHAIEQFLKAADQIRENIEWRIQSHEVFTRDLAQQLMYYGDQKKIRGLLNVLNIRSTYAICGIVHYALEADQDDCYILDEAENFLDSLNVEYAAQSCKQGVMVFLFCKMGTLSPDVLEPFTQLTRYLEENLCAKIQLQVGDLASIEMGYPQASLDLLKTEEMPSETLMSPECMKQLEKAVEHKDFHGAMAALKPALEAPALFDQQGPARYQLILLLAHCTRQSLLSTEQKDSYTKLTGLVATVGREQIIEGVAQYLKWLLRERNSAERFQSNAVQSVLEKVQQDCSYPWNIGALAEALHVNPYYLSHLFKEYTGQCFTDYLAGQRIKKAVALMQTTDMSLAQIGELVGYEDANYFSRVFKKRMGIGFREFSKSL